MKLRRRRMPHGERDASWYDDGYRRSASYREPYYRSRYYPVWAVIADRLSHQYACRSVLDIGCGTGQIAALLSDHGIDDYTGVDFSLAAIKTARQLQPHKRFRLGDALDPEIYIDVDAIVCTEVLEHVERDLDVVRLFPAGTRCLCTVPDFPYESHVRHFDTPTAVSERYAQFFEAPSVAEIKTAGHSKDRPILRYFLLDGIAA